MHQNDVLSVPPQAMPSRTEAVRLTDSSVHINGLEIHDPATHAYLQDVPMGRRDQALVAAVEVGVTCIERANRRQDLDYVRRELDSAVHAVETLMRRLPAQTERLLTEKIAAPDGVLSTTRTTIDECVKGLHDTVSSVRELYSGNLDPASRESTLGRAFVRLEQFTDPKHGDSIQQATAMALRTATAADGHFARVLKDQLAEGLKPLREELDRLAKEVNATRVVEEALEETTVKGKPFEEAMVVALRRVAQPMGIGVEHVGGDNRPGDVVLLADQDSAGVDLKIVVETRDHTTSVGRKSVTDTLARAMAGRGAAAGIYLSKTRAGLGSDLGDWAEGRTPHGPFVVTTPDFLSVAVRFILAQHRVALVRTLRPAINVGELEAQVELIRTSLAEVKNINTNVTEARKALDKVQGHAEKLRDNVRAALVTIEDTLRAPEAVQGGDATVA